MNHASIFIGEKVDKQQQQIERVPVVVRAHVRCVYGQFEYIGRESKQKKNVCRNRLSDIYSDQFKLCWPFIVFALSRNGNSKLTENIQVWILFFINIYLHCFAVCSFFAAIKQ